MIYDVAIVGAGPAGLMAARVAAEKGLKVALIDRKGDIANINRACCMQFIMDEDYESETIRIEKGKVVFTRSGFAIDYQGPLFPMTDKYFISPKGHTVHFAYADKRPIIVKFDKALLLQNLLGACEKAGVEIIAGRVAHAARETGDGVEVKMKTGGRQSALTARKLIGADGANAGIAETLGMNRQRTYFATGLALICYVQGVKGFDATAWKSYFGRTYQSNSPVMMAASLFGSDVASVIVIGSKKETPKTIYNNFTTKSPLAPAFEGAKVLGTVGCSVKAFSSLLIPHQGNTLIIGDAAAYVEIEIQGALMSGFRAGGAVAEELEGKEGFSEYTRWWQNSFEFNTEQYLRVAQGFALVPAYTDDELDYLFSLIENEVLEGTYNQYKSPKLIWDAILRHQEVIAREQPALYEKIQQKKLSLRDLL